ncbi:MAG: hypothetical protein RMJ98_15190 [Myxococcales bacterium]|nr:hypothetical protein [Myxococcales bacterium]
MGSCFPDCEGLSGGALETTGSGGQAGATSGSGGPSTAGQGGMAVGTSGHAGAGAGGEGGDGGTAGVVAGSSGVGQGGDGGSAGQGGTVETGIVWSANETDNLGSIEALAATETEVYWVRNGTLFRTPVGGEAVVELASGILSPREMLADKGQLLLAEAGKISSCTLPDCKDLTVLVTNIKPTALAVDATSLFWIEEGTSPDFTDGTVHRCGRLGCASPTLMTPEKNEYRPGAVITREGSVFWINQGDLSANHGLLKRLDAGGPGGKGELLAKLLQAPLCLAYQDGLLFWMEEGLSAPLRFCQVSSCTPTAALAKPSAYPIQGVRMLRADSDGIYWVGSTIPARPFLSSTAMQCPLPTCTEAPKLLWQKLRNPRVLATNSLFVFLGDASAGGTVYRVKKL